MCSRSYAYLDFIKKYFCRYISSLFQSYSFYTAPSQFTIRHWVADVRIASDVVVSAHAAIDEFAGVEADSADHGEEC